MNGNERSKTCIRCKETKNEELFGWHNKQRGWRRTVCRECRSIDGKSWKKVDRDRLNKRIRNKFRERKKYWVEQKGGRCSICKGVFHVSCYDFHHTDPSEKDLSPGQIFSRRQEVIEKEMNKCILVCSNCHRVLHNDY